jgi:hypothetical protein
MFSTTRTGGGDAVVHGGRPRPIAPIIILSVISYAAALPKISGCAKWKRSPVQSAAVAPGGRRPPRVDFSPASNKLCGSRHEQIVHDLFGRNLMPNHSSRRAGPAVQDVSPTPERYRQGQIERVERSLPDNLGRSARPYRAVDTLAAMERRGTITPEMRQAGEDFRARFATAQLDPLSAFDLTRLKTGRNTGSRAGEEPGLRIEHARDVVWRAILAVGGLGSAGGSCLWHVLGWERTLKEWALEQGWNGRRVSQEAASGILIASLGALEAYLKGARNC